MKMYSKYNSKRVGITTLHDKKIRGAQEFIQSEKVQASAVMFQVGSNDLEQKMA